jgi:hypothetical protein
VLGHPRRCLSFAVAVALAAAALTIPMPAFRVPIASASTCVVTDEVRATTCRLNDGATVTGTLGPTPVEGSSATYRLDALAPDTTVTLRLAAHGGSTRVSVVDWRGQDVASGLRADDAPDVQVQATLPLPGTYAVRVSGDLPAESPEFQLTATVTYPNPAGRVVWPASLATPGDALTGERMVVRTPRGGTPSAGLAIAQALGTPPDGAVGDFMLVAEVQFEKIVGASAMTVRFRYEPEAGGGTGYFMALDPVAGTATLDSFDEGQRTPIVSGVSLAVVPTSDAPSRLVLQANGPAITVTLDGQPVLDVADGRYSRGLIAVGAVTWSEPVAVLFDHIQVTTVDP